MYSCSSFFSLIFQQVLIPLSASGEFVKGLFCLVDPAGLPFQQDNNLWIKIKVIDEVAPGSCEIMAVEKKKGKKEKKAHSRSASLPPSVQLVRHVNLLNGTSVPWY